MSIPIAIAVETRNYNKNVLIMILVNTKNYSNFHLILSISITQFPSTITQSNSRNSFCLRHFVHNFMELITHCLFTTLHQGSKFRSCSGIQESCRPTICAETVFHDSSQTKGAN